MVISKCSSPASRVTFTMTLLGFILAVGLPDFSNARAKAVARRRDQEEEGRLVGEEAWHPGLGP